MLLRRLRSASSSSFGFRASSSSSSGGGETSADAVFDVDEWIRRGSNQSFPNVEGKILRAEITKIDRRAGMVTADVGHRTHATFVLGTEIDSSARVGDVVETRVRRMFTPFGEMDLECAKDVERYAKRQMSWQLLKQKFEKREVVRGRVLNAVNGGFAVGCGGHVGFLPNKLARDGRGRRLTAAAAENRFAKDIGGGVGGEGKGSSQQGFSGRIKATPPIGERHWFRIVNMREEGEAKNFVVGGPEVEGASSQLHRHHHRDQHRGRRDAAQYRHKKGFARSWDGRRRRMEENAPRSVRF